MKKLIAVLLGVAALIIGIGVSPAAAAGNVSCRSVYYADGKTKFAICHDYDADIDGNGIWTTFGARVQNVPTPSGHTDLTTNACWWSNTSGSQCANSGATEGQTIILGGAHSLGTGSTVWFTVRGKYGDSNWCHRIYFNSGGGSSVTNLPPLCA